MYHLIILINFLSSLIFSLLFLFHYQLFIKKKMISIIFFFELVYCLARFIFNNPFSILLFVERVNFHSFSVREFDFFLFILIAFNHFWFFLSDQDALCILYNIETFLLELKKNSNDNKINLRNYLSSYVPS